MRARGLRASIKVTPRSETRCIRHFLVTRRLVSKYRNKMRRASSRYFHRAVCMKFSCKSKCNGPSPLTYIACQSQPAQSRRYLLIDVTLSPIVLARIICYTSIELLRPQQNQNGSNLFICIHRSLVMRTYRRR